MRGPGWEIRYGDGLHRRRNSATAWRDAVGSVEMLVAQTTAVFRTRTWVPRFKLTEESMVGLDGYLASLGWVLEAPTRVLERPVERSPIPADVLIHPGHSEPWVDAFTRIAGYDDLARSKLHGLLSRILHATGFASITIGDTIAAVGMTVVEGADAGLFEIATDPAFRGRGLGGRIVTALESWAAANEAHTTYLQVEEANGAARRLYDTLGYEQVYRYWYRTPGGRAGN